MNVLVYILGEWILFHCLLFNVQLTTMFRCDIRCLKYLTTSLFVDVAYGVTIIVTTEWSHVQQSCSAGLV